MSPASAAIFDLDGTLFDSIADIAASGDRVLESRGFPPHSLDEYRGMVGHGLRSLLQRAIPKGAEVDLDELMKEFRSDYWDQMMVHSRLYDGVLETLEALKERGVALAILSNKPHRFTRQIAGAMFPDGLFTEVFGHRDEHAAKPDPSSALELATILGVAPEQTLFVGDSKVDMGTARAAGMRPVAVSWGYQPAEELVQAGASTVLRTPADLLDLV